MPCWSTGGCSAAKPSKKKTRRRRLAGAAPVDRLDGKTARLQLGRVVDRIGGLTGQFPQPALVPLGGGGAGVHRPTTRPRAGAANRSDVPHRTQALYASKTFSQLSATGVNATLTDDGEYAQDIRTRTAT